MSPVDKMTFASSMTTDPYTPLRQMMVEIIAAHTQVSAEITGRSSINPRILEVMGDVPRQEFVPAEIRAYAHADGPLPIGWDKTISQPFITALMTELLEPGPGDRVLEIGTGLGYHTAVLSRLAKTVYTVEIVEELATGAERNLKTLGCKNVVAKIGNGYYGWPDEAPFDRIIVAAAPELVPPELIRQLAPGGRMVVPAGLDDAQQLMLVTKDEKGKILMRDILAVRFAQMEGVV